MNALLQLFIHFGWYKVTVKDIREWSAARKVALLKIALRKSNYKIRKEAAKALGLLKDKSAVKSLLAAAKDEVRTVAETAKTALISVLGIKNAKPYLLEIEAYWTEIDRVKEGVDNYHKVRKKYFGIEARTWDKSQMKTLDKAKKFLKQSTWGAGGKWSI